MSSASLLSLLHLCDSLFPTGGFAHSDGLEAATALGQVSSPVDLRAWMDVCLDESLARVDGPAVWRAWQACAGQRWSDLDALNEEVHALRPSSAARSASRAMGARLIRTWQEIHPDTRMAFLFGGSGSTGPASLGESDRLGARSRPVGVSRPSSPEFQPQAEAERTRPTSASRARPTLGPVMTLPVAFGVVCAVAGIEARAAVEGFIYTRLAATASSAMRLMSIGQREAHALLAAALARVPAAVTAIEASVERGDGLGAFAPALDLATMQQQYVRSRLFLS